MCITYFWFVAFDVFLCERWYGAVDVSLSYSFTKDGRLALCTGCVADFSACNKQTGCFNFWYFDLAFATPFCLSSMEVNSADQEKVQSKQTFQASVPQDSENANTRRVVKPHVCAVCCKSLAKYRCPGCQIRTCVTFILWVFIFCMRVWSCNQNSTIFKERAYCLSDGKFNKKAEKIAWISSNFTYRIQLSIFVRYFLTAVL